MENKKTPRILYGEKYRIKEINCAKNNTRRLAELGILEGSEITIHSSNVKTYRVKIGDSFFALDDSIFKGLILGDSNND